MTNLKDEVIEVENKPKKTSTADEFWSSGVNKIENFKSFDDLKPYMFSVNKQSSMSNQIHLKSLKKRPDK